MYVYMYMCVYMHLCVRVHLDRWCLCDPPSLPPSLPPSPFLSLYPQGVRHHSLRMVSKSPKCSNLVDSTSMSKSATVIQQLQCASCCMI